jgi:hypothetical protein
MKKNDGVVPLGREPFRRSRTQGPASKSSIGLPGNVGPPSLSLNQLVKRLDLMGNRVSDLEDKVQALQTTKRKPKGS